MECGCVAPTLGGNLGNTCGSSMIVFMTLLDSIISKQCDISVLCERVQPRREPDEKYDFVVIGGGTGGATAAGLLAEERKWKVLLIEAGNDEPAGAQVPSMYKNYLYTKYDYVYRTEPEPVGCQGETEKRCVWNRGKVLGGCGVINGMMYMRGVPRDYDKWEEAGIEGWSYKDVFPYFIQQEGNTQVGTVADAEYHGTDGPLTVAHYPSRPALADDIVQAGKEMSYNVSKDLNGKQITGFAIAQATNRNGTRLSAARAFLHSERSNSYLHVMLNSTATKIEISKNNNKKVASRVHVHYAGKNYTILVKKEVIVAGGAINTPQLLMLSGIGPKNELKNVGIKVVHELPGVGRSLTNHVSFYQHFKLNKVNSTNELNWAEILNYITKRKGPLSSTGMAQTVIRWNSKYADLAGDFPDSQMFFQGFLAGCSGTCDVNAPEDPQNPDMPKIVRFAPVNLHPESRGYLTLNSSNPFEYPLIYANYLTNPKDVNILIEGVRLAHAIANCTSLKDKWGIEPIKETYGDCETQHKYDSDDFWGCAIKYRTAPENHQTGSCKMGALNDPEAVVNNKLQVIGIDNMRIMDASVIPDPLSGNTVATINMIAGRGVDFIKRKYDRQN